MAFRVLRSECCDKSLSLYLFSFLYDQVSVNEYCLMNKFKYVSKDKQGQKRSIGAGEGSDHQQTFLCK